MARNLKVNINVKSIPIARKTTRFKVYLSTVIFLRNNYREDYFLIGGKCLYTGCWVLDAGCWMLDAGCWMLDASYRSERLSEA